MWTVTQAADIWVWQHRLPRMLGEQDNALPAI